MEMAYLQSSVGFAQVRFAPTLEVWSRLTDAAKLLQSLSKGDLALSTWNPTADGHHLLRDANRKFLWMVQPMHVQVQCMDSRILYENQGQFADVLHSVIEKLKPELLQRVGFQVKAFVDLEMTMEEMVETFYGTMLPHRRDLAFISEEIVDGSVEYIGSVKGQKFRVVTTPQSAEQVRTAVGVLPHLNLFENEKHSRYIYEFTERIAKPSLVIEPDVFEENIERKRVSQFIHQGMSANVGIIERVVKKFLSLPVKI